MSGFTLLPRELTDGIVSFLDKRDFKSLAVTSRDLRQIALPFLYEKASLKFVFNVLLGRGPQSGYNTDEQKVASIRFHWDNIYTPLDHVLQYAPYAR